MLVCSIHLHRCYFLSHLGSVVSVPDRTADLGSNRDMGCWQGVHSVVDSTFSGWSINGYLETPGGRKL